VTERGVDRQRYIQRGTMGKIAVVVVVVGFSFSLNNVQIC